MGTVHPLDARRRSSRNALVLGGGGFTGGVYEIGALRALDLLAVNHTVNEFDVYVGTSAGAFVAALAANGVTPEEMMRVVDRQVDAPFRDLALRTLLRPNVGAWLRRGALLPLRAAGVMRELITAPGQVSGLDVVLGLADGLPSGMYSGEGLEVYLRDVLTEPGRSDDFRNVRRTLYLTATDLDTCERVVFGTEGWTDVPISRAVRASTALPVVYEAVPVRDRELVDGGLVSTTNLDVAVEAGARMVVVINPLVPFIAPAAAEGEHPRRISDRGLAHVAYQAFKLMAHRRLHELARQWESRYPGVDIVLIEPELDDELMFHTSIMNFASRTHVARHGFASVTQRLAEDFESYRTICERHGLEISASRVRRIVEHVAADEPEPTRAWRRILEQTTGVLLRQSAAD
ncbi:MAG: patatin-like phospholipase family protein [Solirubrobacterales bacterium]|jgi:predicted acylesterase/phospholipase RssA|nr:patatin-like phospholipase family protein [Solirubrobacterales bacterium]